MIRLLLNVNKIKCGRCRKYTCHVQHKYLSKYPGLLEDMYTFGVPEWVNPSNTIFLGLFEDMYIMGTFEVPEW